MSVKTFKTRIKNKIDTISNFTPSSGALIPLKGELIIGAASIASNDVADPYMIKIGDGSHSWGQLPAIGPCIFKGQAATASDGSSSDDLIVKISITPDSKVYAKYDFSNTLDTTFKVEVSITGDAMLTEHYLLLDNTAGSIDRYLDDITFKDATTSAALSITKFLQKDYVSAGDIMELKMSFYKISDTTYCTVTSKSGIVNGGNL